MKKGKVARFIDEKVLISSNPMTGVKTYSFTLMMLMEEILEKETLWNMKKVQVQKDPKRIM